MELIGLEEILFCIMLYDISATLLGGKLLVLGVSYLSSEEVLLKQRSYNVPQLVMQLVGINFHDY